MSELRNETCAECAIRDERIEQLQQRINYLVQDVHQAQHDTLVKNRDIGRLERQLQEERMNEPENEDVRRLLHLWRDEVRGKQKGPKVDVTIGSKRHSRCRWAVKRYGVERTERAILGTLEDPWAMGRLKKSGGRAFNDLAKHILKDEETFEHFEGLWLKKHAVKPVVVAEDADDLPSEQDLELLEGELQSNERLLLRTLQVKGWSAGTLEELHVGFDGQRLVFPIRNGEGELVSIARYLPGGKPKMLAPKGRSRDLFPAPESIVGSELWIVEGEPDAITAHQLGLPAVGVPGAAKWQDDWIPRLAASLVVICFDCDEPGRKAAQRVRAEIESVPYPTDVRVIDLDPSRDDGFDLTDFVLAGGTCDQLDALAVKKEEEDQQLGWAA